EFVSLLRSHGLERLFRRERNAVALFWVQQTSAQVGRIIRQHREASRQSSDLEIATETRIFLQFALLKLICVILVASIGLVGPCRLRGAALYAERLSGHIGRALGEATAPAALREMNGVRTS